MKNLYLVTTRGLGQYYIIANDPTEAENALMKIFNDQEYGFETDRRVMKIEWLAASFIPHYIDNNKPFLSKKDTRLLIVDDWKLK